MAPAIYKIPSHIAYQYQERYRLPESRRFLMQRYIALVQRNGEGHYFLTVPDMHGFTAGGVADLDDLLATAAEVLRDNADVLIEDGDPVPEPRTLDQLRADPDLAEDFRLSELAISLPLLPREGRAERVNITLDDALLVEIDRLAKRRSMTRSGLLAEAARDFLARVG